MGTVYERADAEVEQIAAKLRQRWHPELDWAQVAVTYLMASNDDGAAVTVGGYPAAAKVSVIPLKQRADGRADAEVVIDAEQWASATSAEREALIDHELHHLEVQCDQKGHPKRDDLGRTKLKLRKHDHQFGWFDTIARRHGDASYEVRQAKQFADAYGQLYFGWQTPPDRPIESAPATATATDEPQ